MKLSGYFPSTSGFQRDVLTKVSENVDRLGLAVTHSVTGTYGGREVFGRAEVRYKLDYKRKMEIGDDLTVDGNAIIGFQSTDYIGSRISELKPRVGYAVQHMTTGKFDMRALLFVLGQAYMGGAATTQFADPVRVAGYSLISEGYTVPAIGEITLGHNIAQTSAQLVTLMYLAHKAGVSHMTFLGDSLVEPEGKMLTGRALSVFALRVANNMLKAAAECNTYGSHRIAFLAGQTSVVSLHGHSDEGGWIRKLLRSVHYPKSTGIVAVMGAEFDGVPLTESVDANEVLKLSVASYLEEMALIHVADVSVNGHTSIYKKDEGGIGRPSDFGTFVNDLSIVLNEWRRLLCDKAGQHVDQALDIGAYLAWAHDDKVDRHLEKIETFVPFWWVETSPLLTKEYAGYSVPAKHTGPVELPLTRATNAADNAAYHDAHGRMSPGSDVCVVRKDGATFREEGIHFLGSQAYVRRGLLHRISGGAGPYGERGCTYAFADDSDAPMSRVRWSTPDNPMPSPVEGLSDNGGYYNFRYDDLKHDPTTKDLLEGKIVSRLGTFSVYDASGSIEIRTSRTLPARLMRKLRPAPIIAAQRKMSFMKITSEVPAPARPGGEPQVDVPGSTIKAVRDEPNVPDDPQGVEIKGKHISHANKQPHKAPPPPPAPEPAPVTVKPVQEADESGEGN